MTQRCKIFTAEADVNLSLWNSLRGMTPTQTLPAYNGNTQTPEDVARMLRITNHVLFVSRESILCYRQILHLWHTHRTQR